MAKEKICGIYKIKNIVNGKVYIGSSIDVYRRWIRHRGDLRHNKHSNKHLQNAWNKYKEENFKFDIIEILIEFNDLSLKEKEQYWIEHYNSQNEEFGYNLISVPEGIKNKEIYEECISKFRKLQPNCKPIYQIDFKGNIVKKWDSVNQAAKTLKIRDQAIFACINKIRRTYKSFIWIDVAELDNFDLNNYINIKYKKCPILQFDLENNFIKEWSSFKEICDYYKFNNSNHIIQCCKGKGLTAYGYKWKYKNNANKEVVDENRISKVLRPVVQLDLSDNLVCKWNSISEAAKKLDINPSDIGNCAKGRQKTAYGFKWMYLEDYEQLQKAV